MELRKCLLVALTASMLFGSMAVHANRDWVTFKAQQSKSQVVVDLSYKPSSFKLQYYDQTNKKWVGITTTRTFTLTNVGDSVQVRGQNPTGLNCVESGQARYIRFQAIAGQVAVSGDLLTLVDTTTTTVTEIPGIYCFYRLFSNSNSCLVDASRLRIPVNTIAKYSCMEMFNGNYGLKNTPDMSQVKSIGHHGCEKMFMNCKGLEETADMPNVRTVGEGGCQSMYSGCIALKKANELYAKYAYESAYNSMFQGCTSLTTAPKMNAVEMFAKTCMSMYKNCTKLTSVPDLEAPYLENDCYRSMFEGCTALENAPAIKASELGYTIHGKTIYYKTCLKDMFKGCSNLKYIEVYFSDWFDSDASKNLNPTNTWVLSVPTKNTCVFSAPCELPDQRGNSYIPTNWQFRCFNTLTLNVEENGGSWSDNKDYENRIYKSDVSTIPTAEKKDYIFTGWFEHADGTGKQYTPGSAISESCTFYACFKPKGDIPPVSESCIDYTDFTVTTIDTSRCYENNGKYYWTNWSTTSESLDYGPRRKISRYTVHRNTNEYDGRTGGLLKTTLPDDRPSVRLGNWLNKGAERITYKYKVPSDKTVLMLYYAAVLEDPKHSSDHQPRFTLEMKDKNGATLGECVCFDFKSGAALGDKTWHIEDDICWKDWTAIGVNLKDKAGEDIQICLTTYDCIEGGHFGYAYFALDCSEGEMKTTSCGASEEATFKAPDGFKYKWYEETTPETIISTKQSITVSDAKGKTYMCDVINPEKEDCYFTLKATPETRYPLAMYDTTHTSDGKVDVIRTTNNSCVSNDGTTPKVPKENVDSCHWALKDKTTGTLVAESSEMNPVFRIENGGVYELTLQAFLKNGDTGDVCDSEEKVKQIVVKRKGGISYVPQDTILCGNTALTSWKGHTKYVKIDDKTYHDTIFSGSPQDTTVYILNIKRQMAISRATKDAIVKGQTYTWRGKDYKATSLQTIRDYDTTYYPITGCDSVYYSLELTVTEHPMVKTYDKTCANEPYTWQGHESKYSGLKKEGLYYDTIVSGKGDTTFYMLSLTVNDTFAVNDYKSVTMADFPFPWNGYTIQGKADDGKQWRGQTIHGCDSVVTLRLQMECQGVKGTISLDTICADQKEMYATLRVTAGKAESYSLHYVDQDPKGHFQDMQDIRLMGSAEERLTIPFVAKDSINYIRPNDYNVTISVKDSCGKTVEFPLVLHVQYPSWIIQQRWNDVLAVTNENYNGGYVFSSIIWYHEGERVSARGEHNSYLYSGPNEMLQMGTRYWAELTRNGEEKGICTCALRPEKNAADKTAIQPMQIAKRQGSIQVKTEVDGTYTLYDVCGKLLETGKMEANNWQQIADNIEAGAYIILFQGVDGRNEKNTFIKN